MTTSKQDIVSAVETLSTNINLLYDTLPHPCGAQGPEEIYSISYKSRNSGFGNFGIEFTVRFYEL
jgi:hypothetical protein